MDEYKMSDVTSITGYTWDGKNRPVLSDYTSPWDAVASSYQYENVWNDNRREHNSAITYAINKLNEAKTQYDQDLAYWNERDERSYTTPIAQTQRYEDAGYNLGYLYGNVDSGNSAVGYHQNDSQYDNQSPKGDETKGVEVVAKLVGLALDVAKVVPSIAKLPSELNLNKARQELAEAQANDASASATIKDLQSSWFQFLREHDKDGKQVGYREDGGFDWSNSIAFLLEQENYKLKANERQDLDKWLEYAGKLYDNQSKENVNSVNRIANEIWNSDLPNGIKIFLGILQSLLPTASKAIFKR